MSTKVTACKYACAVVFFLNLVGQAFITNMANPPICSLLFLLLTTLSAVLSM